MSAGIDDVHSSLLGGQPDSAVAASGSGGIDQGRSSSTSQAHRKHASHDGAMHEGGWHSPTRVSGTQSRPHSVPPLSAASGLAHKFLAPAHVGSKSLGDVKELAHAGAHAHAPMTSVSSAPVLAAEEAGQKASSEGNVSMSAAPPAQPPQHGSSRMRHSSNLGPHAQQLQRACSQSERSSVTGAQHEQPWGGMELVEHDHWQEQQQQQQRHTGQENLDHTQTGLQ